MTTLVPFVIALPLVVGALLAAAGRHLPRKLPDVAAIATTATVAALCVLLMLGSTDHAIVYWFGGWTPAHGVAPGIAFVVDPQTAAEAALAGLAVLASLVFGWRYFESTRHLFHTLMLFFLAGMVGFVLSGDLFNIFVFFELMSVTAYALCAYRVEQRNVLQGALNFAILGSIGTFLLLMGIAMLYGGTGALNLAAVGEALARQHSGGLLVATLTLITVGFLVKAGAVPFHFWLSDAYAVASAPVAAIFTAVMSDLAFHVYSRVYSTVFADAVGPSEPAVRTVLLAIAVSSAVLGAVMCLLQADMKRQLAFLTISNGGAMLAGIALQDPQGAAGTTGYVVTSGMVRGALMLGVGMAVTRLGTSDEMLLRGRGRARRLWPLAAVVVACGLALAAPPPFGPFRGLAMIYDSALALGYGWLPPLLAACLAVTAGAVLRAAARVFLGWGPEHDPLLTSQPQEPGEGEPEPAERGARRRLGLLAPAFVLVIVGCGLAFWPHLADHAIAASRAAHQHAAHAALVLHGTVPPHQPVPEFAPSTTARWFGAESIGGAFLVAAVALWWRKLVPLPRRARAAAVATVHGVKALHDGSVGDYATWLLAGAAVLAVAWTFTLAPG